MNKLGHIINEVAYRNIGLIKSLYLHAGINPALRQSQLITCIEYIESKHRNYFNHYSSLKYKLLVGKKSEISLLEDLLLDKALDEEFKIVEDERLILKLLSGELNFIENNYLEDDLKRIK